MADNFVEQLFFSEMAQMGRERRAEERAAQRRKLLQTYTLMMTQPEQFTGDISQVAPGGFNQEGLSTPAVGQAGILAMTNQFLTGAGAEERHDFRPLAKEFKIPENIVPQFENLTLKQATELFDIYRTNRIPGFNVGLSQFAESKGLIPEGATKAFEAMEEGQEYANEQIISEITEDFWKRGGSGDQKLPLFGVIGKRVMAKVNAGARLREDFTAEEWTYVNQHFPSEDRREAFLNYEGDREQLVEFGTKIIGLHRGSVWVGPIAEISFTKDLKDWMTGDLKNDAKRQFFDKFYDKNTGQQRIDRVFEEGQKLFDKAGQVVKSLNIGNSLKEDFIKENLDTHPDDIDYSSPEVEYEINLHGMNVNEFRELHERAYRLLIEFK